MKTAADLGGVGFLNETGLTYERLDPSDIPAPDWRQLIGKAITPSIFCDPLFVWGLQDLIPDLNIEALVIRDPMDDDCIVGLWLLTRGGPLKIAKLEALKSLATPFSPLGVPLISAEAPWRTVETALTVLGEDCPAITLDTVPLDDDLATIIQEVAERLDLQTRETGRTTRATLRGGRLFDTYAQDAWSAKRRSKLRRMRKKLDQMGEVTFTVATGPNSTTPGIDAFLELEASGWKGEKKTAMASNPRSERFFREVIGSLIEAGGCEIHSLCLNHDPIAMFVMLRQREHSWTWKIAYDEAFSALMPGHLLIEDVTLRALSRGDKLVDSCATDDNSLADPYWVDRMAVGQLHIALKPGIGHLAMLAAAASDAAHDSARHAFRRLRRG